MCNYMVVGLVFICGHRLLDSPLGDPVPCDIAKNKTPFAFCAEPATHPGGDSKKRLPCDDCIAKGIWVEVPGTRRYPNGKAMSWLKS